MSKTIYIEQWVLFFTDYIERGDLVQFERIYTSFNVLQLEIAFSWTLEHFAELDLGGNYKWHETTKSVLKNLKKRTWDSKAEQALIAEYITDTRWYDF